MRKCLTVFLVMVLMATNGLLIGCGEQPGEAKDLDVELSWVTPVFAGRESVCLAPVWIVRNPNNFPVTVEKFDYVFRGEGMLVGKAELGGIYIPANTEVKVSDICVVEVGGLNGPIVRLAFDGDMDQMKAWADESEASGIIALFGQVAGTIEQLKMISQALGQASMLAGAAGEDAEAAAKLRAISDQLSPILNSDMAAGILGPGAGDKLAAAADHAEAAQTAELAKDAEILQGLTGILSETVVKLVQGAAATAAMPKWKALGGKLPMPTILAPDDLKNAWETIPAKGAAFESEGKVLFSSVAGEKTAAFAGLAWMGTAE